jgi:CheY-like chemotaxis protein
MTILLVDDEPHYLMLTRHFLEDQGWNVITAEHGEEGLEKLAAFTVSIVVSDVYMPIMDGLKFHKAVRALPQHEMLPFLFVSAYDDTYTLTAVAASRNDGFLRKGRPTAELKEWIVYLTTPVEKRGAPPSVSGAAPAHPAPHVPLRDPRNARRGDGTTR